MPASSGPCDAIELSGESGSPCAWPLNYRMPHLEETKPTASSMPNSAPGTGTTPEMLLFSQEQEPERTEGAALTCSTLCCGCFTFAHPVAWFYMFLQSRSAPTVKSWPRLISGLPFQSRRRKYLKPRDGKQHRGNFSPAPQWKEKFAELFVIE